MKKRTFFRQMEKLCLSLTFDDVRLASRLSFIHPDKVTVTTKFSRNITLNIPIVSAAMDTVTEHKMAIAMAECGGIGVIHRNLSPKKQAEEVEKVKRYLNGLIENPTVVYGDETVEHILSLEKNFHTFPVLSRENRKCIGVLTRSDLEFCENNSQRIKDIMSTDLLTAPQGFSLSEAYDLMRKNKKKMLPLVKGDGSLIGMYVFSDLKRIKSRSSLHNVDNEGHLRVAAAIGVRDDALERISLLREKKIDAVVIDTAHADTFSVIETLREIKKLYSDLEVVVGNVSEGSSARNLANAGADGIKVGQGSGAICTTRVIAGIGRPQVTAVYNCVTAIEGEGIPVCADGGIKNSGDITIAIGAGAHSVMLGGLLAGTDETPGEIDYYQGARVKAYRGMGSVGAMMESKGSRDRYRQSLKVGLVPEGIEGVVSSKGPVRDVLAQYIGGLRSGMGYVGASTIQELRIEAKFFRITHSGFVESHPHDVIITKEAPNYRREGF